MDRRINQARNISVVNEQIWEEIDSSRVDSKLVKKYVEQNPHRYGFENARLKGFGVSVWAIVGQASSPEMNVGQIAADYELPQEAVLAALGYYKRHQQAINARLADNER